MLPVRLFTAVYNATLCCSPPLLVVSKIVFGFIFMSESEYGSRAVRVMTNSVRCPFWVHVHFMPILRTMLTFTSMLVVVVVVVIVIFS